MGRGELDVSRIYMKIETKLIPGKRTTRTTQVGDVFKIQFPNVTYYGRVMMTNVAFGGFKDGCTKIHVYKPTDRSDLKEIVRSGLLIPPQFINNLGFSRGYFQCVGNVPIDANDNDDGFVYIDSRKWYFDQYGNRTKSHSDKIGVYGLGNYLTVEDVLLQL
jgi:hypothetical protein